MRALVVDDDAMNRDLLRRMLARLGWVVDDVPGGRKAVEACARSKYEIVFLDLFMPIMDGIETAEAIVAEYKDGSRDASERPRLVVVTGAEGLGEYEGRLFDAFLKKPYILNELSACIADALADA